MNLRPMAGIAVVLLAGSVLGAEDYFFPTSGIPQGVDIDTVKQLVTFIWDDNAYSGLAKTDYELHPDEQENNTAYANHHWVGGLKPWENGEGKDAINKLNIQEGDMGMSWAITTLAGRTLPLPEYDPEQPYKTGDVITYEGKEWQAGESIQSRKGVTPVEANVDTLTAKAWVDGEEKTLTYGDEGFPAYVVNAYLTNYPWEVTGIANDPEKWARKNPDNSPIHFTFNVISGLFVPQIGSGDGNRISKFGYWHPNEVDLIAFPHLDSDLYRKGKLPIVWGREQPIHVSEGKPIPGETYGRIVDVFEMTRDFGHEIGNHTIDHLESNSLLPRKVGPLPDGNGEWTLPGFDAWGGEGYAEDHISPMKWGNLDTTASEVEEFGKEEGITWHKVGWEMYAGRHLSTNAWDGLIKLGEEDLELALGIKPTREGGDVMAFRAPRLEVNGAMFYALDNLGYTYDCGIEEGYEYHVNGTNFYWPYTTDNGSPNYTYQRTIGENISVDSMPAGLWQVPVNCMIVPPTLRAEVFDNYSIVSEAEGHPQSPEDRDHWITKSGKITGFDFNMFILWGMTADNALKTLEYNLDKRMEGNKAPMQIGSHSDYFSPIYDNATLLDSFNRPTYGLCVDKGWNDWKDRKKVFEDFIDYGLSKGAYFWSGAQVIEYTRLIAAADKVGTKTAFDKTWEFFKNEELSSSTNKSTFNGSIDATINVSAQGGEGEDAVAPATGYSTYFNAGELSGLDHISLTYETNYPFAIKLIMENDTPWEVWLNNLGREVESGAIPLKAFHYNQYDTEGSNSVPNADDIVGIEIQMLTDASKEHTANFKMSNFSVYRGDGVAVTDQPGMNKVGSFRINGVVNNNLHLTVPVAGAYDVNIVTLDGRIVRSLKGENMTTGINSVDVSSLANGVYLLNVSNGQFQKTLKAIIM